MEKKYNGQYLVKSWEGFDPSLSTVKEETFIFYQSALDYIARLPKGTSYQLYEGIFTERRDS